MSEIPSLPFVLVESETSCQRERREDLFAAATHFLNIEILLEEEEEADFISRPL